MTTTSPRIYVGTYAKYNNGSIEGAWLDLEDYSDKESFLEACRELHKDESDPEFMFQDFEGFPRSFYSESGISDELFDWIGLDEHDRTILQLYSENGCGDSIDDAREAFAGTADSLEDFAANLLEETGELNEIPERLRNYFDFAAYARDLEYGGDVWSVRHDGQTWIFWNR